MKDSERLARIDQKLTDFIDLYREHRAEDKVKLDKVETLTKKIDRMERPFKWAGGLVTASIIGGFTILGEKAIQWTLGATHAVKDLSK